MKKRIRGLLLAQFLIFATVPATGFADEEKSRENLANLLNYAQVSIHVITEFNNRIVLDKEYRSIINNLSLREIPDERVIQLLKELMDALTESTLSDREREQVDRLHTAAIKDFSRDFYQGFAFDAVGTSVDVAVSIASQNYAGAGGAIANLGMSYWDYQAQVENMQAEKDEDLWEIENKVIRQLNEINKEMLELSWRLYNEYEIPEAWRLVQKDIAELIKLTRERDVGKRFRLLRHSYMKERFSNYAPYWYYLGSTANQYFIESGDTQYRDEALQAYEHYDVARSPVLKKDEMYASVALGRAQLLDPDKQRDEVIRNLRIIEAAPPENWMTISGMALLYARIGEYEKAREWAQRNIDLGDSDPIFHQQLMGQILGRQGDLKALDQLISEMVSGSNAKIFEIMDMVGPLSDEQIVGRLRSSILQIRPSVDARSMLNDHILLEVPLALQVDTKEVSLVSGRPIYDPDLGILTMLESGALPPDDILSSDDGKTSTYRFKGSFDSEDWREEDRSHALFRFSQDARKIDLLYAVRGGNEDSHFSDLELLEIDGKQFVDRDGSFIPAGALLREAFDASFDGLVYELSVRYGLDHGAEELRIADLVRHLDRKGDRQAVRDLVERIEEDSRKSYLDVIEIAQAQEDPRETLQTLPFEELVLSKRESLVGAAYNIGSEALKSLGAGDYGEGREDIVLTLPSKWVAGKKEMAMRLSIQGDMFDGNPPVANDRRTAFEVVFASAFQVEQWRDLKVENVEVHIGNTALPLVLDFNAQQILGDHDKFPPAGRIVLGDVSISVP